MKSDWSKEFFSLLASARDEKEIKAILEELLTPNELQAIAERWQIVKLLLKGTTQRDVRDTLKVAIATVSRGARVVHHGEGTLKRCFEKLYQ